MAYKKKDKVIQNISEFSAYKELLRMKKERSPHSILFCTEDPEGWFINCVEYRTKSGVVMHDSFIIEKDMPGWISWHKNLGWIEV
jgi:hypothetical protein